MAQQRQKAENIRITEQTLKRERQLQKIGVPGREGRYNRAVNGCKNTFMA